MFVCELYAFMAVKHGICVAICLALRWHFNLNSSWQLQKCSIFFFTLFVCWFCPSTCTKMARKLWTANVRATENGEVGLPFFFRCGWHGLPPYTVGVAIERGELNCTFACPTDETGRADWPTTATHLFLMDIFSYAGPFLFLHTHLFSPFSYPLLVE